MTYTRLTSSAAVGYLIATTLPVLATVIVWRVGLPEYVFEQLIVLLVVGVAIRWSLSTAIVTAVVAVLADDLLLREPIGTPSITGIRDVLDLLLFVAVAITVAWLVARSERDRRTAQAAAARERRAREDRDRLIDTITHDLANPLAAIRGTVRFAQQFGSTSDLDLPRLLSRLDTAAGRATSLLHTLSDAKSLDAGQLTLNLREMDVRDLVAPVVHMFDQMSDRHPIVLRTSEKLPFVRCDLERMQRVIENLIGNAIKYSPDGGHVEVTVESDSEGLSISVRDEGIGISPEALPHIFERSFRAPEAVRAAPGVGLGLHTAAEIVRRHGGTLTGRPAQPHGAVLTVRLPRAALVERPSLPRADFAQPRMQSPP